MNRLRCYNVQDSNLEWGIPVIAKNAKEAKKIGFIWAKDNMYFPIWIKTDVNWKRNANIENLDAGVLEDQYEAMYRHMIDFIIP